MHRNVNPSNILLSRYGQVKLSDFGVVKMRGRAAADTEPGLLKGNFAYLPPEYIRGEHLDHRIDVYAAGVVLFELVTGTPCFRAEGTELFKDVLGGMDVSRLTAANVPDQLTRRWASRSRPGCTRIGITSARRRSPRCSRVFNAAAAARSSAPSCADRTRTRSPRRSRSTVRSSPSGSRVA